MLQVLEDVTKKIEEDEAAHHASMEQQKKKKEETAKRQAALDRVLEERRLVDEQNEALREETQRWANALNNMFKALSMDLEQLGVTGGRVMGDSDLVMLMGVVEEKAQKVSSTFRRKGFSEVAPAGEQFADSSSSQSFTVFPRIQHAGLEQDEEGEGKDGGAEDERIKPMSSMDLRRSLTASLNSGPNGPGGFDLL